MAFKKGNLWEFKKGNKINVGRAPWNKGKTNVYSEETIQKLSEANKGQIPWNKGLKCSPQTEETKQKIREANIGKRIPKKIRLKMSLSHRGKRNGNWKGGIARLQILIRNNSLYRQWRSDVFTRDNFTCQECGQTDEGWWATNIKSFSSILQYYEITTLEKALKCEELWNINNGITLCKKCHRNLYKHKK